MDAASMVAMNAYALNTLSRHLRRLAPYVTGSLSRRKGAPYLYLHESREPGGERALRRRGESISALCEGGFVEEGQAPLSRNGEKWGGIGERIRGRALSAGPARDLVGGEP
jgi:hypothetical protein